MNTKTTATIAVAVVAMMVFAVAGATTYSWFSDTEETDVTVSTAGIKISGVFTVGDITVNGQSIESMGTKPVANVSGNQIDVDYVIQNVEIPLTYTLTNDSTTDAYWRLYTSLPAGWQISDIKINDGDEDASIKTGMMYLVGSDNAGMHLKTTDDPVVSFVLKAVATSPNSEYTFEFDSEAYQFGYNYSAPIDMTAGTATIGNVDGQDVKVEGMTSADAGNSLPIIMEFDQNTNDMIKNKTLEVTSSNNVKDNTIQISGGNSPVVLDITLGSVDGQVDLGGYVTVTVTIPGNVPNAVVYYNNGTEAIPVEMVGQPIVSASGTTITFKTNHFSEYVIVESEFEASVGSAYFNTIDDAINNVDEGTIELMKSIVLNDTLTIGKGKVLTLDMNGKSISQLKECSAHYTMIKNDGELTITGNGLISFTDTGKGDPNFGWGSYTISNHNVLVIENGTILNDSKQNPGNGVPNVHMYCAIQQGYGAVSVTINDGTISTPTYRSLRANVGDVVINGGEFEGQIWLQPNQGNVTIEITGGEFSPRGNDGSCIFMTNKGENNTVSSASILGGTFNTKIGATDAGLDGVKGCISGGNYTEVAKENTNASLLAEGFVFVKDGDYYGVALVVNVDSEDDLGTVLIGSGMAGAGDTQISINCDLDMDGIDWTPVKIDGYHGADIVTVYGNGHTITNLSAPLFAGGFAGGSGIIIKDLTIADSDIISTNTLGSGAFIETVDSMDTISLINCHLKDSKVTGGDGSRTGGLIGWTSGYNNVNDGPVKTYVTIKDCSVIGCEITSNGSVGGINGHAGANAWTYTTISNCTVRDCTLNSTDDGSWRVGVVVGTANVGEVTIEDLTESGNTLTQTGKTAPAEQSNLYGRLSLGDTGKLIIDGVEFK